MVIDRNKHNKYSTNQIYGTQSQQQQTEQAGSSSSTTIIYQGGGSGLTEEQKKKLDSIEEGAQVNQNAFSKVTISDGSITNEITANNPSDNVTFQGVNPIKLSLIDGVIQISYEGTSLWQLDEDGNLWTDRNVYSTKEISAYGYGEGEQPTGAQYLYELKDVDSTTASNPINKGILQYNSTTRKWEVTDGSNIKPDLTGYATQSWVTEQLNLLVGSAPDVLDTIYEIAEALNNDPDYVKDIANNLSNLTNRVVKLEDMFEWDGDKIKAKADLYGIGEISAYGYGSGEAPTGAQYLHELKDVTLTEITAGQLLQWDGLKWVNINKDEVGLNESELNQFLINNNYAKISDITWGNVLNKPDSFTTSISDITDLNQNWYTILNTTPKDYITRWPQFSEITNKPNTLEGYGITDGVNSVTLTGSGNAVTTASINGHVITLTKGSTFSLSTHNHDSVYVNVTGDTMSGTLTLPTIVVNTRIQLGNAYIEYDSTNNAVVIKNKTTNQIVNFYATGEVSAYGFNDGESSSGVSYLSELKDVNITSISENDMLVWNGSKWYNVPMSDISPELNLDNVLDLNANWVTLLKNDPKQYVTRWPKISEVTNKQYLIIKLNSGTTEGTNLFTYNATTAKTINITPSTIGAAASSHNHSWANITSGKPTTLAGYGITDGVNAVSVTGSGNAITAASINGHTLTLTKGSTFLLSSAYTAADILAKLKTVDGSGSGLDADLLDGYQLTSLFRQKDLTPQSLNADKLNTNYNCYNPNSDMCNWSSSHTFTNFPTKRPQRGFSLLTIKEGYYRRQIYGAYNNNHLYVRSSIQMDGTKWKDWNMIAFTTDNVASATKLQTARTIWGQSFDGTANVSGALTGVTDITASGTANIHGLQLFNSDSSYRISANFSGNIGRIYNTTSNGSSIGVLYIGSTGGSALNISSTYNVGIGTASPSYKLHVAGTMGVTGAVTMSSTLNVTGSVTASVFKTGSSQYGPHSIELYHTTPFIDFHFNNSTADYTSRIIESTSGVLTFTGQTIFIGKTTHNGGVVSTTGSFSSSLGVSGTLTASGATTLGSTLSVTGRSTLSGGITVGYSNTSYSISTNSFICQSWVRTTGSTGWYNETYGGGTYMTDSTYVRIYNSKQLYVANNIVATGEITAYSSSDIRLKTNLKELKAINTLRKINTFEYDWTEEALQLKANKNTHDYGIIAQELELIIPEAVTHDMYGKGYLGIDYTKLIPFTISAIKEVDDEVTTLKKRVKELEDRLSKYESSVK